MSLTIEQLKFAREIGATHIDLLADPDTSIDYNYRKDLHAYVDGKWDSGWARADVLDDDPEFARIDFTPLDDYYADKSVDIAATGGELEYDPADVAFKRPAADMVNHPPHYQTEGIECIDAIRAALGLDGFVAHCRGNAIKYSWRAGKKDQAAQDLRKAAWYLNRAADELEKNQ